MFPDFSMFDHSPPLIGDTIMIYSDLPEGYIYSDDRLGIVDTVYDWMYVMSDYGNLVMVPYSLWNDFYQYH